MKVVLIDHEDSFVFNLQALAQTLGHEVQTLSHRVSYEQVLAEHPDVILIGPGPGHPDVAEDLGVSRKILSSFTGPLVGVCLGMQAMASSTGAKVARVAPLHGESSVLSSSIDWMDGATVGRYHSLGMVREHADLAVLAHVDEIPMVIEHRSKPWIGYQFHPESILTPDGARLLQHALTRFL